MYEYITGRLVEKNPAYFIVETNGLAYYIHISLQTYSSIGSSENVKLFLHYVVREDARLFFGFANEEERKLFRLLISVSGVGANTARLILSSINPVDLTNSIASGNVELLQAVKGIGSKTAQRILVDLKDKIAKADIQAEKVDIPYNNSKKEALSGLIILGFNKSVAEKALDKIIKKDGSDLEVEDLIKRALKIL